MLVGLHSRHPWGGVSEKRHVGASHVSVAGGALHLSATPDSLTADNGTTYPYTSGVVNSEKGYSFLYGFAEARIAVPEEAEWWPAWWMCAPNHWPPEIDIAEFFGTSYGKLGATANTHWDDGNGHQQNNPTSYGAAVHTDEYHTYGMLWESGSLQFFCDGQAGPRITQGVPNEAMYFIFNLALHKDGTPAAATMKVDYVRVWKDLPF